MANNCNVLEIQGQFLSPIVTQPLNQAIKLSGTYGLAGVLMAVLGTLFWIYQQKISQFFEPF
ncbi:MAG: hypothetical protein EAZ77_05430 [Nostocales cyanobacterium]|nr:MAG: hypothetical protein EAZ77_05430 [Nostocales cyanobacterium]